MKEVYLTQEGFNSLQERLDYLTATARNEVANKIKVAREYGDISENAEYDAAKDEQVFIEQEIKDIEEKLAHAVIISTEQAKGGTVVLGATVKVYIADWDEEEELTIVGTTEADITKNRISNESPLGKALIGKKQGAVVDVTTPNGSIIKYKVVKVTIKA